MEYFLYVIGEGGESAGCDYTIGCNQTLVELSATTKESALKEAMRYAAEENCSRVKLLCCDSVEEMPVKELKKAYLDKKKAKAETAAKQTRKQEYEKLRKEFES